MRLVLLAILSVLFSTKVFGQEPSCPASGINFSGISSSSITVNWTNGCGNSRLILAKAGSSISAGCEPTDLNSYTGNSNFSSATTLCSQAKIVYTGSGNSVTVTGLTGNTTYYFKVFEYNTTGPDYRTSDAPSSSTSTTGGGGGGGSTPTTQASNISFTSIQTNQVTITLVRGNGDKVLIAGKIGDTFTETPPSGNNFCNNSGTSFGTGDSFGAGVFAIANLSGGGCGCPQNGSGNQVTVTALSAGTTYTFRAFEAGGGSCSPDYNITTATGNPASVTTVCASPTLDVVGTITQTSFQAKWLATTGATKYFLDVSTVNDFSTLLTSYNNLDVGNVTSASVSGLTGGTTYFYRVRAYNSGGTSANSSTGTVLLIPSNPVANSATSITQNSFTANWSTTLGATGYYLDVSTANDFSSFVSGYQNASAGNVSSTNVSGLSAGTTYYYRVRSSNALGTSSSSNTTTTITVPPDTEVLVTFPTSLLE